MIPYKVGFCPQCGEQIQVQDCSGRWSTMKPNFRQAELYFENGHRVRTIICSECLKVPDLKALFDSITHPGSTAASRDVLDTLMTYGQPIGIVEVKRGR